MGRDVLAADRAANRPLPQHDLVSAEIQYDLAVIGAPRLVELGRDHDPDARMLVLVHRDQQQMSVAKAEARHPGRIVELDRWQVADLSRCDDGQMLGGILR